jgi:Trypsin-co-occurring domain 2
VSDLTTTAVSLVRDMKSALVAANDQLGQNALKVTKVDLELHTVINKSAGGEISIKVLEIGGDVSKDETNTLSLTLVPSVGGLELMASAPEDLVAAIVAIGAASWEAANAPPAFDLNEATVELEVGVTTEGQVKFFAKGSGSREQSHSMAITLAPIEAPPG